MEDHLRVLLADYPRQLGELRRRALPYSALHVALNAAACSCFAAAVWYFPPGRMERWDLLFLRYGSVLLTPVAFLADVLTFGRTLMATFGRDAEADGAV